MYQKNTIHTEKYVTNLQIHPKAKESLKFTQSEPKLVWQWKKNEIC